MTKTLSSKSCVSDVSKFLELKQKIISLSSNGAFEFILNYSNSKELVHSFSEETVYFFLDELGSDLSVSILSLASETQWEFFFDMEIWKKDFLNFFSTTNLLFLMLEGDTERFIKWCFHKKIEFIKLYLFRNIEVKIISKDNTENLSTDFFSYDGYFYIRLIKYDVLSQKGSFFFEKRDYIVKKILSGFAEIDHIMYQNLMLEINQVIPAELEERLYRLRNNRIVEKNFLPFHEAIGIYTPLYLNHCRFENKKDFRNLEINALFYPSPYFNSDFLNSSSFFIKSLLNLNDFLVIQEIQIEFASLCNNIISAEEKPIKNYKNLKNIIIKANNFLNIGLELILGENFIKNIYKGSSVLEKWPIIDIFRVGYTQVLSLRKKVIDWFEVSWFKSFGLKSYFWGENFFCIIGGLILNRPLYYIRGETHLSYRDFQSLNEIYEIEKTINKIIEIDKMFHRFNIKELKNIYGFSINFKNLILTMWVLDSINYLEEEFVLREIPFKDFKLFFSNLWENDYKERTIKKKIKKNFLNWFAKNSNLKIREIPTILFSVFDDLFLEIEDELRYVSIERLDPRYINLFFIEKYYN